MVRNTFSWGLALGALVILGGLAFFYLGDGASGQSHINVSISGEPESLDPAVSVDISGAVYINHVFEGLTRIGENNQPEPAVATSWDVSSDGKTYTFHLDDEAKWSDGRDVTAGDFVYAWKRVLSPEVASRYVDKLYFIENAEAYNEGEVGADAVGVRAVNEKTLQVVLERPTTFFLNLTALNPFFPVRQDLVGKGGLQWTQSPETYVGNGPYVMTAWNHNGSIEMAKNLFYPGTEDIKINTISWKLISDSGAALNAFEAGEIDFNSGFINTSDLPRLEAEGKLRKEEMLGVSFIVFNTEKDPLGNLKVRQALELALNRKELIENVLKDGSTPATGFIPLGVPGLRAGSDYREDAQAKEFFTAGGDLERAKVLLAEAGYPGGKGLRELEFMTSNNSTNKLIAEYIQNQLGKLGVRVRISLLESKAASEYRTQGRFDISKGSWGGDYADVYNFLSAFVSSSPNNYPRWYNSEYDDLVSKTQLGLDRGAQLASAHKAEELIMTELPVVPLNFLTQNILINPKLKGVYINPLAQIMFTGAYWGK